MATSVDRAHGHLRHSGASVNFDDPDVEKNRRRSELKLQNRFEAIFAKYSRDFDGISDEIDLRSGKIEVDNGHLQHMRHERDVGRGGSRITTSAEMSVRTEVTHRVEDELSSPPHLAMPAVLPTPTSNWSWDGYRSLDQHDRNYSSQLANQVVSAALPSSGQFDGPDPVFLQQFGQNLMLQVSQLMQRFQRPQGYANNDWTPPSVTQPFAQHDTIAPGIPTQYKQSRPTFGESYWATPHTEQSSRRERRTSRSAQCDVHPYGWTPIVSQPLARPGNVAPVKHTQRRASSPVFKVPYLPTPGTEPSTRRGRRPVRSVSLTSQPEISKRYSSPLLGFAHPAHEQTPRRTAVWSRFSPEEDRLLVSLRRDHGYLIKEIAMRLHRPKSSIQHRYRLLIARSADHFAEFERISDSEAAIGPSDDDSVGQSDDDWVGHPADVQVAGLRGGRTRVPDSDDDSVLSDDDSVGDLDHAADAFLHMNNSLVAAKPKRVRTPVAGSWTLSEDSTIIDLRRNRGFTFSMIVEHVPGRTYWPIYNRWYKVLQHRQASDIPVPVEHNVAPEVDATTLKPSRKRKRVSGRAGDSQHISSPEELPAINIQSHMELESPELFSARKRRRPIRFQSPSDFEAARECPLEANGESGGSGLLVTEKRKRGRPRKHPVTSAGAGTEVGLVQAPPETESRKLDDELERWRPRKVRMMADCGVVDEQSAPTCTESDDPAMIVADKAGQTKGRPSISSPAMTSQPSNDTVATSPTAPTRHQRNPTKSKSPACTAPRMHVPRAPSPRSLRHRTPEPTVAPKDPMLTPRDRSKNKPPPVALLDEDLGSDDELGQ